MRDIVVIQNPQIYAYELPDQEADLDKIMAAARKSLACIMEAAHTFAIICLLVFMTYKAKDPIKELFGPAPWINSYDDYFFMTSQGIISNHYSRIP